MLLGKKSHRQSARDECYEEKRSWGRRVWGLGENILYIVITVAHWLTLGICSEKCVVCVYIECMCTSEKE